MSATSPVTMRPPIAMSMRLKRADSVWLSFSREGSKLNRRKTRTADNTRTPRVRNKGPCTRGDILIREIFQCKEKKRCYKPEECNKSDQDEAARGGVHPT